MNARSTCQSCRRPVDGCYCHRLRHRVNRWPVHILQHPAERRHALGTARIAALSLADCRLHEWSGGDPAAVDGCALIYPGPQARPLAELTAAPRPLLFLDATWRKSRRMLHESALLARLPRYGLERTPASRYRIRRQPRTDGVSTLEAIVLALEQLEQAPGKYHPMLEVMDWMVERQIECMGETTYRRNYLKD